MTSVFQTECVERRQSSATERFRTEWHKFAFFPKFATFMQKPGGKYMAGDTESKCCRFRWFPQSPKRVGHFSEIGHFLSICSKNHVSSLFSASFACLNLKFPKSTSKRQKKIKSAHWRKSREKHFPAGGVSKNKPKENQHRKPSLLFSANLAYHETGRMVWPSRHENQKRRTTAVGTFVGWLANVLKMRDGKNVKVIEDAKMK